MPSAGIVPALDEGEDGHAGLGLRAEAPPVEELAFEGGEEALAHGIIIGVADRSHGRAHASLPASHAEGERGVLHPWSE